MVWNSVKKLADAIFNDITGGLKGYHNNPSISIDLLQQDVVDMRLLIIKEYMLKGILPVLDLLVSLNCIPVDCNSLDKCGCNATNCGSDPIAHFLIPLLLFDYGLKKTIYYLGTTDKTVPFLVYTSPLNIARTRQKYRKRGKEKPWVYIDITPNLEGFLDCYIFNAPLIQLISIIGIFKDLRQLEGFQCNCDGEVVEETFADNNFNFIDTLIKDRLTQLKLRYYRQFQAPVKPNDLQFGEA